MFTKDSKEKQATEPKRASAILTCEGTKVDGYKVKFFTNNYEIYMRVVEDIRKRIDESIATAVKDGHDYRDTFVSGMEKNNDND